MIIQFSYFFIFIRSRIWLSGVGIADILDGAINGTVHQNIVNSK
jgi:hypothetical protein